jgi:mannose-1-phosphate guanylyltransferase
LYESHAERATFRLISGSLARMANVWAVIMAGGAGTRFWPASRQRTPKQLLPLAGRTDEPLLTATVRRLSPLVKEEHVLVVTGEHLAEATARAVPRVPRAQILCEPAPRNTAPCIAWATATIARGDPNAVIAVLPSDHFIADEPAFRAVLARAAASAERGNVTTVGIVPTRPETGYGYIEVGEALDGGARSVVRFVEKPDRERAEAFLAGGKHLWNAGMFFFRAADMKVLLGRHLPEIATGVGRIDASRDDPAVVREVFPKLPSISIDHGVMEKASGLAVVPGNFGWNDVGSWQSAWELAAHDAAGNALSPGSIGIDAKNNLVRSLGAGQKPIAVVGVDDLVVVDTDDAILVIPRERAQDVRLVVEALKKAGRSDLL